jgi:Kdo2-lipid IVA lauroyltransferase/acyltransferase
VPEAESSAPARCALTCTGIRMLGRLGYRAIHRLGGAAGRVLAAVPNDSLRATRLNLEMCLPELDAVERRNLERASLIESGRTMLELGALWCWPRERVLALVRETEGLDLFQAALARKRGVLLLTPHLGSWELAGLFVSSIAPVTAMYTPPRHREMERFYNGARERLGARLVPADASGVRALHRAIREGQVAGVLPDQDPGHGSGLFVPFFGVLANTTTLVAKLAHKTGAPVVLTWAERLEGGAGYRMHFVEPAMPELAGGDTEAAVRAMNRELERLIRSSPCQYLWSYKRFRYRPPGLKNPYRHGIDAHTVGVRIP